MSKDKNNLFSSATVSIHRRTEVERNWKDNLSFFCSLLSPFRLLVVFMVTLTFLAVVFEGAMVFITREIIDRVVLPQNINPLDKLAAIMALFSFLLLLSQWAIGWISSKIGSRMTASLRTKLHTHALDVPVGFYDLTPSGKVNSIIIQDTMNIERFVIEQLPFILVNIAMAIGFGIVLFSIDILLGLIAVLPAPFLILGAVLLNKKRHKLVREYFGLNDRMNTVIHETVSGIKPIKASCHQPQRAEIFRESSDNSGNVEFRINWINVLFSNIMTWVMTAGTIGIWCIGSGRVVNGTIATVGTLVAFVGLVRLFHGPLQFTTKILHQWIAAMAAVGRIAEFLDTSAERHLSKGDDKIDKISGKIDFEDVRFSYIPGIEVIKGINFSIKPGEIIGLVGRSGVGKTTVTNLICRFYDIDSGVIKLDGKDIRLFDLNEYRSKIGIVLQEPFLFRASIADNIGYSCPGATMDDIVTAAKKAQAHEFIEKLENGYDTRIGDKGVRLSVGESQRITIARAILQDPAILILDEATSNLDSKTEQLIQEAILELIKNRTTIAIAHRLGTLRHATRLMVLQDGELVESGTHDELASREGGAYAELVKAQAEQNRLRELREVWKM